MPSTFISGKTTTQFDRAVPDEVISELASVSNSVSELNNSIRDNEEENIGEHNSMKMTIYALSSMIPFIIRLLSCPVMRLINHFTKWYQYDKQSRDIIIQGLDGTKISLRSVEISLYGTTKYWKGYYDYIATKIPE